MIKERWRPIKEFEDLYIISDLGNISDIADEYDTDVKQYTGPGMLLYAILIKEGKKYNRYIHRLVYQTFVGELLTGYLVHHKDEKQDNNYYDNLEQMTTSNHTLYHTYKRNVKKVIINSCTSLQNYNRAEKVDRMLGESNKNSKLTVQQVICIKKILRLEIMNIKEISAIYNVSTGAIYSIKYGNTWGHILV